MEDTENQRIEQLVQNLEKDKEAFKVEKIALESTANHRSDLDIFSLKIGFDNVVQNLNKIELLHQKIKALDYVIKKLTKN